MMKDAKNQQQSQLGVSLVELLVVVAGVIFLILMLSDLPSSISSINKSNHSSVASEVAAKKMEEIRNSTYANIKDANGLNYFTDSQLNTLPSVVATYDIEDCPSSICTNGENVKQVTVEISWNESGDLKKVDMVSLVGDGGLGQ